MWKFFICIRVLGVFRKLFRCYLGFRVFRVFGVFSLQDYSVLSGCLGCLLSGRLGFSVRV